MKITNPNRDRQQASDRFETQQKQSGDQHILPADEPAVDPHRPHRVNREDRQKLRPSDDQSENSGST
jgi:hypothetical protein